MIITRISSLSTIAKATAFPATYSSALDTVRSNAEQFEQPYDRELHRVIIHGILHLCGINDKGPGEREIMEAAENKALALISL